VVYQMVVTYIEINRYVESGPVPSPASGPPSGFISAAISGLESRLKSDRP